MASAGFLGALGGLGQGLISEAKNARENERADLDEARDIAKERFRAKLVTEEGVRREGVIAEAVETKIGTDATAFETKNKAEIAAAALLATGKETQSAAEIAGRQAVTDSQNTSRERVAGQSGKTKFTLRTDTVAGKDGDRLVTILFDGLGNAYELEGTKYWLPGSPQQTEGKTAPQAAVDRLMESPELASTFQSEYGYVPKIYVDKHVFASDDSTVSPSNDKPEVVSPSNDKPEAVKTTAVDKASDKKYRASLDEVVGVPARAITDSFNESIGTPVKNALSVARARSRVGEAIQSGGGLAPLKALTLADLKLALPTGSDKNDELVKRAIASLQA